MRLNQQTEIRNEQARVKKAADFKRSFCDFLGLPVETENVIKELKQILKLEEQSEARQGIPDAGTVRDFQSCPELSSLAQRKARENYRHHFEAFQPVWILPLLPLMESSPEAMIPRETTPLPYLLDRDGDPYEARERRPNLPSEEEVSAAIETLTAAFGSRIQLPAFSKTKKAQEDAERSPASNSEGVPRGHLSGVENHPQMTSPKPQRERRGAESTAPFPSMQREAQRNRRSSPVSTEHNSRVHSGAAPPAESQASQDRSHSQTSDDQRNNPSSKEEYRLRRGRERKASISRFPSPKYNKNNDKDGNYRQNPKCKSSSTNVIEGDKPRLTKMQLSQQWLIDLGASNHVISDKRLFTDFKEMDSGVKVANGIGERVKGKGDTYIPGLGLYVPGIDYNLLATLKLSKDGHIDILFSKGKVYVAYGGEKAGEVVEKDGLPHYVPIPSITSCERVKDERTRIPKTLLQPSPYTHLYSWSDKHASLWIHIYSGLVQDFLLLWKIVNKDVKLFWSTVSMGLHQNLLFHVCSQNTRGDKGVAAEEEKNIS
ncbi:hypothetical protein E2320_017157 [Naja naja]|nr:hypothetical protein E2320_017157 [Naja naja]